MASGDLFDAARPSLVVSGVMQPHTHPIHTYRRYRTKHTQASLLYKQKGSHFLFLVFFLSFSYPFPTFSTSSLIFPYSTFLAHLIP